MTDPLERSPTRTRDLAMFAALSLGGLAISAWLFFRGDMLPVILALAATGFAAQQLVATLGEP